MDVTEQDNEVITISDSDDEQDIEVITISDYEDSASHMLLVARCACEVPDRDAIIKWSLQKICLKYRK